MTWLLGLHYCVRVFLNVHSRSLSLSLLPPPPTFFFFHFGPYINTGSDFSPCFHSFTKKGVLMDVLEGLGGWVGDSVIKERFQIDLYVFLSDDKPVQEEDWVVCQHPECPERRRASKVGPLRLKDSQQIYKRLCPF